MIFKCKNCGGNVIYSPEHHKMYCPFCDSFESQEKKTENQSLVTCINCGGEIHEDEFTSASKCPYCDNYIIFDERVSGQYLPKLLIPFQYGKESVKQLLRNKFKSCAFAPSDFLSEAKLNEMKGMYVPFWMYDYHVRGNYEGEGKKVKTWVSGEKEYTETSVYRIVRDMETDFDKMPVDASNVMPNEIMDLLEPYDYNALQQFNEEYMSGFFGERYNEDDVTCEPRAVQKAKSDAEVILKQSISGYTGLTTTVDNQVTLSRTDTNYTLLPVWIYNYKYKDVDYTFHVNGQTGKIIGKVPISKQKVLGYSTTVFGSLVAILMLIRQLLLML